MVLVDTSIWIDHLRGAENGLAKFLEARRVLMHPFVIGELACGRLTHRDESMRLLRGLPGATVAEFDEVLGFVESRELFGRGIGWVDAHLLAATVLDGARLWTRDARLRAAAQGLGVALDE